MICDGCGNERRRAFKWVDLCRECWEKRYGPVSEVRQRAAPLVGKLDWRLRSERVRKQREIIDESGATPEEVAIAKALMSQDGGNGG